MTLMEAGLSTNFFGLDLFLSNCFHQASHSLRIHVYFIADILNFILELPSKPT